MLSPVEWTQATFRPATFERLIWSSSEYRVASRVPP